MDRAVLKRGRILAAAERLFATRPFHKVTMEEVARRAGVGKGTIYRYFRTKEDVFFEAILAGYDELRAVVTAHGAEGGPLEQRLLEVCNEVAAFYQRRFRLFQMMQAGERWTVHRKGGWRTACSQHGEQLVAAVADILHPAQAQGMLGSDIPVPALAALLLGLLRAQAWEHARDGGAELSCEQVVRLFCHGTMTRPEGGRP